MNSPVTESIQHSSWVNADTKTNFKTPIDIDRYDVIANPIEYVDMDSKMHQDNSEFCGGDFKQQTVNYTSSKNGIDMHPHYLYGLRQDPIAAPNQNVSPEKPTSRPFHKTECPKPQPKGKKICKVNIGKSRRMREMRPTEEQKACLLDYMQNHIDFAKGKYRGPDGARLNEQIWRELTAKLNACEGVSKSSLKWQKSWKDFGKYVLNKSVRKHGNGKYFIYSKNLSPFEEKVLEIINSETTEEDEANPKPAQNDNMMPTQLENTENDVDVDSAPSLCHLSVAMYEDTHPQVMPVTIQPPQSFKEVASKKRPMPRTIHKPAAKRSRAKNSLFASVSTILESSLDMQREYYQSVANSLENINTKLDKLNDTTRDVANGIMAITAAINNVAHAVYSQRNS